MRINFGNSPQRKRLIFELFVVVVLCLVVIIEINIFYRGFRSEPNKSDAIIVLGCAVWGETPSPMLKQRIYKAAELYNLGFTKKIIASGGMGYKEKVTESSAIKKKLIEIGIPEDKIIEENKSTNTLENLKFSKEIMKKNNLESVIIVTNYFHIYRSSMLAHDLGIKASYARAPMPPSIMKSIITNAREVLAVLMFFLTQVLSRLSGH